MYSEYPPVHLTGSKAYYALFLNLLLQAMYVTSPLAIFMLFTLLIFSHTAVPDAHRSLAHFFTDNRPAALQNGGSHSNGHSHTETVADSNSILTSELASPMVMVMSFSLV